MTGPDTVGFGPVSSCKRKGDAEALVSRRAASCREGNGEERGTREVFEFQRCRSPHGVQSVFGLLDVGLSSEATEDGECRI
jgi:hypothetical protein